MKTTISDHCISPTKGDLAMTELFFTARALGAATEYTPIADHHLRADVRILPGTPAEAEITITAEEAFQGVIRIALPVRKDPRFFLPGVIYGTNRGDAPLLVDSNNPRLRHSSDFPASPWWMFRSDRLSHPCAFAWADGRMMGLAASPYYVVKEGLRTPWEPGITGEFDLYTGFGCTLDGEIWYTLGYENAPWFFLDSHQPFPRAEMGPNCITLEKGESISVQLHLFDFPAEDERGLHTALKWVYSRYHESPRRLCTVEKTVQSIAEAIARDAWLPDCHSYTCFVFDRGDHYEYNPLPSISWTNGLSALTPMLQSAHMLGNEAIRAQALEGINHIVRHSMNERNDLPFTVEKDGVWSNRGWWYDRQRTPGHTGYLVGQAVYLILKAYAAEKAHGIDHPDWLDFAARVIARTEKSRNADGEYPYILSEKTGAGVEYDSFSGAWCMAAAAYYSLLTGDKQYLPGLKLSADWYHSAYIRHQECYGGPLDIDKSIDSEGILSYIRAVRCLHEITGEELYLDYLQDALHYEYTFKFCYNSPIKVPPLSTVGWSSCGGSITSVTNPHIHPMSSSVMGEMAYYLRQREDAYIRSRLEDTKLWSCQCHATFDKEYGIGRKGWMSERFCHSEGLVKERWPDGSLASTWFALMPWACGSILEGLCSTQWE